MLYGRLGVMVARTLAFMIVRRVLGLVGLGPAPDAKDVEIAVLRHQLMVVRRQVARPRYPPHDRLVWGMLARLLPRQRWQVFLITPSTCSGGTASWLSAAGSTRPPGVAAKACRRRWLSWCGWRGRTRA